MPFAPSSVLVPSSKAGSPVRSVLAPFVAMPFARFVASNSLKSTPKVRWPTSRPGERAHRATQDVDAGD